MTQTYNDHRSDEATMDISSVFHRDCFSKQELPAADAEEAVSVLEGTVGRRGQLRGANRLLAARRRTRSATKRSVSES